MNEELKNIIEGKLNKVADMTKAAQEVNKWMIEDPTYKQAYIELIIRRDPKALSKWFNNPELKTILKSKYNITDLDTFAHINIFTHT